MAWKVPAELEQAVHAATRSLLGDAPLATSALTRAIVDRSRRYTSDRERLATATDRAGDLAARAMFFTIADAMKIAIPLAELASRNAVPARRPLRVVDLGAGCGAMSLGLIAALDSALPIELLAIDRDASALDIARSALERYAASRGTACAITTRSADVGTFVIPHADLIVIGTLLNELRGAAPLALVERCLAAIADDGAVILIEPALRDTTRALHELRDAILTRATGHVFAPCTRRCAPCPMLADPGDWCHEDRALALPPRTAELARLTHLRDSGMKLSYLVLRRQPLALVEAPDAWRVVSAPRRAKGKVELDGCNDHGVIPIRLLRRHRSEANRAFEDAARGDVIVTDAAPGPDRVELEGASRVCSVPTSGSAR